MGLFFNYNKSGPGIDQDAPKKWGIFLYFELLGRNLSKLLLSNMLYFAVSLPVLTLYYIIISIFAENVMPESVNAVAVVQFAAILTLLVSILWGTGPASLGYTYILRNTAREEHTFLISDFFEKTKKSFFRGLVFLIVDIVLLASFSTAILTYWELAKEVGGIYTVLLFLTLLVIVVYTIMHFYLYEMEVTFNDKILTIYKNSFLMALATLPMCVLIGILICIISLLLLSFLVPFAILIVGFLCWIGFMRFMVDFYTARTIKRVILCKNEEDSNGEE